ncbi:probable Succinyl-CoA ligase [ADP-forming] subunit beta, mitochondrial [Saccharomycodes ludwigii]|uniref:Succinate--CoA ligase [ADP-forming] subunit beta, mitochondrial n=1 Tax=Saccharomycodes ludwigii TaxID=36035 RepID=A0A376BBW8_9ASCO|nr:hypothetical protein SCDLUD_004804 [Saccharomycodes ludwigii]KAH3899363.1 hypothetical protein SCDLUD_004804 [Saccharomycodes ludwigii]SSD62183.1 probable Succinyl-CoA ligase [ADP-forming] subunit beta, mitochondrial [Saccharomycodes ludwigii]
MLRLTTKSTTKNLLTSSKVITRNLSIHEYRSAQLLNEYKVGTPKGYPAHNAREASEAVSRLFKEHPQTAKDGVVVKAQALTGGRGKGHFDTGLKSGVHFVSTAKEAESLASQMINHKLITKQTGEKGKKVSAVFVVEKVKALHEAYLSILMDRTSKKPLIICCSEGGMNIEEVAKQKPDAIKKFYLDPIKGLTDDVALNIAKSLGFDSKVYKEAAENVQKLYKIFTERDATQIEINPFSQVEEVDGHQVMCMDAKFGFDDNAAYRQQEIYSWRDISQEDPDEVIAKENDLNFVKLKGNIGLLVNGAGLAMATMDVIHLYGGSPANFLDCGGGATPKTIETAFRLILTNPDVKAIFVNIFGGIVRCDYVAAGLVAASKSLDVKIPIVARLQGTKLAEGQKIIKESGLKIYSYSDLDPAAKKVVEFVK